MAADVATAEGTVRLETPLVGRGNLANVLAGLAVGLDAGVPLDAMAARAATLAPASHRGEVRVLASGITIIDDAYNATQSNLAEVGARTRALDGAAATLDALSTSYTNERAANANISIEEATLHLAEVQTALNAAFLSTSKILNTSLTEYLR